MQLLLTLYFFLVGFNSKLETDHYDQEETKVKEQRELRETNGTIINQWFYRQDGTKREKITFYANGINYHFQFFYNDEEKTEKVVLYDEQQIIFFETTDQKIMELIEYYNYRDLTNNYPSFSSLKAVIENYRTKNKHQLTLMLEYFNQALADNKLAAFIEKYQLNSLIKEEKEQLKDKKDEEIKKLKEQLALKETEIKQLQQEKKLF